LGAFGVLLVLKLKEVPELLQNGLLFRGAAAVGASSSLEPQPTSFVSTPEVSLRHRNLLFFI
jgi:hypothetical protein